MKTNKPDQTDQTDQHGWVFNGHSVLDSKGRNVCLKVNGPLIAAAPDLLEACLEALRRPYTHETTAKLASAIAKATGKAGAK